jgi:hypothetical protein
MKILCCLGFHKWLYHSDGYGRRCQRPGCGLWQFKYDGQWFTDILGTADTTGKHIGRWYIKHKDTHLYLGSCHTTGDGIWTTKENADHWDSQLEAVEDGMHYHPFQRLKGSVVDIVCEE